MTSQPGQAHKQFLVCAGIAAIVTALTTLGVHLISFSAVTFEERLLLARDPLYNAQKWMIIVHCLMVIFSMYGVSLIARAWHGPFTALGFLFFTVFGIAEIGRMFSVFGYLNPLRERYLATDDEAVHQILTLQIEAFGGISLTIFLMFITAFALGNLFFGLALRKASGMDRWVAYGFLLWALLTFLAMGNTFWESSALGSIVDACNTVYQPVIRLLIGMWLLRKSRILAL